jgi:hypothetical protein
MRSLNASHIDFNGFVGVIPSNPRFLPSDLDMILERRDCFLVGEWKRSGETMSDGQLLLLKSLARQPQFIVLIIEGNTDDETVVTDMKWVTPSGRLKLVGSSFEELRNFIARWYKWVEGNRDVF